VVLRLLDRLRDREGKPVDVTGGKPTGVADQSNRPDISPLPGVRHHTTVNHPTADVMDRGEGRVAGTRPRAIAADAASSWLEGLLKLWKRVDPQVLAGGDTPGDYDFSTLRLMIAELKRMRNLPGARARAAALGALRLDPAFQAACAACRDATLATRYGAAEFELKSALRRLVEELNAELPSSLRLPLRRLAPSNRDPEAIAEQARLVVRDQEALFTQHYASTGFASAAVLEHTLATPAVSAATKRVAEMLRREQFEVVTNKADLVRDGIARSGFQNLHVIKRVSLCTPRARATFEACRLGKSVSDYAIIDDEVKPKYCFLRPRAETGLASPDVGYGGDSYVFKLERIRDRLTWTLGDSMDRGGGGMRREWMTGSTVAPRNWDELFAPWRDRALIAPVLGRAVETDSAFSLKRCRSRVDPAAPLRLGSSLGWADYVEMQIWGPLTLDDVSAFEFARKPPTGQFLQELTQRGIPIYDGRTQPPKPWDHAAEDESGGKPPA
jgi:hypothetical protein